jgi:hypothetical protein
LVPVSQVLDPCVPFSPQCKAKTRSSTSWLLTIGLSLVSHGCCLGNDSIFSLYSLGAQSCCRTNSSNPQAHTSTCVQHQFRILSASGWNPGGKSQGNHTKLHHSIQFISLSLFSFLFSLFSFLFSLFSFLFFRGVGGLNPTTLKDLNYCQRAVAR